MPEDAFQLTPSQERAYNIIMNGRNVFLTGHAGTGKSFLTRKIIDDFEAIGKNVVVAAPTGIAAINIGGTTLHRLFELKPDIYTTKRPVVPDVIKETDVIIIDEISMCRIDLFEYIGKVLHKADKHIQLIVVGDFCQLPPVMPKSKYGDFGEKEILDEYFRFDVGGGYAFKAPQWEILDFCVEELREVVRQTDAKFIHALDSARLGEKTALRYFYENTSRSIIPDGIYLAGRNKEVDALNDEKLNEIQSFSYYYEATSSGEVSKEDKRVAPELLELKVGARVMMTVNDPLGDYFNGTFGYVSKLRNNRIWVEIDDGPEVEIEKHTWEIVRYSVSYKNKMKQFNRDVVGKYTQFPIKLAYAITIHKSQGQTFSKVNLNPQCWDSGQLYVALSRVTSVEGLHLTAPMYSRYLMLDPDVACFYRNIESNSAEKAG